MPFDDAAKTKQIGNEDKSVTFQLIVGFVAPVLSNDCFEIDENGYLELYYSFKYPFYFIVNSV